MSRRIQAKLLRVLEEEEYERVGSSETRRLGARVIAASNRELGRGVRHHRFRADLYYRLNVLRLHVPPPGSWRTSALVQHFVLLSRRRSGGDRGVTPQSMQRLCDHDWPGNIRELRNIIQRACVLADEPLLAIEELPKLPAPPATANSATDDFTTLRLDEIERRVILDRLQRWDGNKTAAAAELGVTSRTLRNKLQRYRRLGQA